MSKFTTSLTLTRSSPLPRTPVLITTSKSPSRRPCKQTVSLFFFKPSNPHKYNPLFFWTNVRLYPRLLFIFFSCAHAYVSLTSLDLGSLLCVCGATVYPLQINKNSDCLCPHPEDAVAFPLALVRVDCHSFEVCHLGDRLAQQIGAQFTVNKHDHRRLVQLTVLKNHKDEHTKMGFDFIYFTLITH